MPSFDFWGIKVLAISYCKSIPKNSQDKLDDSSKEKNLNISPTIGVIVVAEPHPIMIDVSIFLRKKKNS